MHLTREASSGSRSRQGRRSHGRHGQGVRVAIHDMEGLAAGDGRREDCIRIIEAGLAAANPAGFMHRYVSRRRITIPDAGGPDGAPLVPGPGGAHGTGISLDKYAAVHVVAFGKAADAMARSANSILQERLAGGIIIIPKGSKSVIKSRKFRVINSGHPVPDQASVRAAKEAVKFLQARRGDELVVFLISGGGSSLLALPDGITLGEKIHVTNLLLRCGASIQELNTVRKSLSGVKGGRLARHLRCDGVGLIMSDVEGDDIASIASGPTHAGNSGGDSAGDDALRILESHGLARKAGSAVIKRLREKSGAPPPPRAAGLHRQAQDAPQDSGQGAGRMIGNYVIARNMDCLRAMGVAAARLGYRICDASPLQVFGDIKAAADVIYGAIPRSDGGCVVFGGETAPKVLGGGKGGRNQELVLRLLKRMQRDLRCVGGDSNRKAPPGKRRRIVVASVGTDGIDGNSIYAGAITGNDPTSPDAIKDAIRRSDSSGFFERRRRGEGGGAVPPSCIRTGPTHTNLMDIGLILT